MNNRRIALILLTGSLIAAVSCINAAEYLTGIKWEKPPVVDPGDSYRDPPSDAIVLFGGEDLSKWENGDNWEVEDGVATVGRGMIRTKQEFGDCQLHIEWSAPEAARGSSQGRGNSGVFFMKLPGIEGYEVQVLDSYKNETYYDGQAGAIYKQTPPMVNAMRPPGEWNTYDLFWTAPRFKEDGSLESPAYITAVHNGVLILNHFELLGDTPFDRPPRYKAHAEKGPIALQDHGNPVRYRNIWVRELTPPQGERERPAFMREDDREWDVESDE